MRRRSSGAVTHLAFAPNRQTSSRHEYVAGILAETDRGSSVSVPRGLWLLRGRGRQPGRRRHWTRRVVHRGVLRGHETGPAGPGRPGGLRVCPGRRTGSPASRLGPRTIAGKVRRSNRGAPGRRRRRSDRPHRVHRAAHPVEQRGQRLVRDVVHARSQVSPRPGARLDARAPVLCAGHSGRCSGRIAAAGGGGFGKAHHPRRRAWGRKAGPGGVGAAR